MESKGPGGVDLQRTHGGNLGGPMVKDGGCFGNTHVEEATPGPRQQGEVHDRIYVLEKRFLVYCTELQCFKVVGKLCERKSVSGKLRETNTRFNLL